MSSFEINKIVGAILLVSLVSMVIGMVGDGLVTPRQHEPATVAGGAPAPAAPAQKKEPEKMEPIAPLMAEANAEQGEKSARKCATCHTFKQGEPAKVGPNLWNVVGAEKAHMQGFGYSSAMQNAEGNWTYEDLNQFLANPKAAVPGTKMVFAGVKSASERADIIAYLRSLSDQPQPLPKADAGAGAGADAGGAAKEGGAAGGGEGGGSGGGAGGGGQSQPGGQPSPQ